MHEDDHGAPAVAARLGVADEVPVHGQGGVRHGDHASRLLPAVTPVKAILDTCARPGGPAHPVWSSRARLHPRPDRGPADPAGVAARVRRRRLRPAAAAWDEREPTPWPVLQDAATSAPAPRRRRARPRGRVGAAPRRAGAAPGRRRRRPVDRRHRRSGCRGGRPRHPGPGRAVGAGDVRHRGRRPARTCRPCGPRRCTTGGPTSRCSTGSGRGPPTSASPMATSWSRPSSRPPRRPVSSSAATAARGTTPWSGGTATPRSHDLEGTSEIQRLIISRAISGHQIP